MLREVAQHQQAEQVQFVCVCVYARDRWILGMGVDVSKRAHQNWCMQHLQEYLSTDQHNVAAAIKLSMSHLPSDHSETQIRRGFALSHPWKSCLARVEQSILNMKS